MLRGVLVRFALMAGVLALLGGAALTPVSAQEAPTFALPGNERLQTLSPDGSMIAATTIGGADLCVFTVPDAEELGCADLLGPTINIDPASISWAPDGSALVFSERAAQFIIDSDLWLFDIESASLTNLTDDGLSGGLPTAAEDALDEPFLVDLAPAWSPDGSTIAFVRWEHPGVGDTPISLMLLDVETGDVTESLLVDESVALFDGYRLEWSASGSTIFASASASDAPDELSGVWAIDPENGDATNLASAGEEFNGAPPSLVAVSPAGNALVISYPAFISGTRTPEDGSGYALLDLDSGDVTPIEPDDAYAGEYSVVVGPNFSPDGSALIFGVRQPSEVAGFVIARDIASGDETVLAELPEAVYPITSDPSVPVQVGGGLALVLTDPSTGVLVELPEDVTDAPIPAATPEPRPDTDADGAVATPEPDGDEAEADSGPASGDTAMTVTIAGDAAVLREGPSGDDDIVMILQPGTELTPIGEAFESDGHFWIEVEVIETGETGFVRTDFLEPVG